MCEFFKESPQTFTILNHFDRRLRRELLTSNEIRIMGGYDGRINRFRLGAKGDFLLPAARSIFYCPGEFQRGGVLIFLFACSANDFQFPMRFLMFGVGGIKTALLKKERKSS